MERGDEVSEPARSAAYAGSKTGLRIAKGAGCKSSAPPRRLSMAKVVGKQDTEPGALAPVTRRFLAYLIDWYLGALCTALPISVISSQVTGDMANQYLVEFPQPWGMVAGVLALLCACFYYVGIPLVVWPGQTPGKRICRIAIEAVDGGRADAGRLALREVLGVIVLEGVIVNASSIWHQMLTIATQTNFVHPFMYAGFVLTGVSCVLILFRHDHRCLHDFIGGTEVRMAARPDRGGAVGEGAGPLV